MRRIYVEGLPNPVILVVPAPSPSLIYPGSPVNVSNAPQVVGFVPLDSRFL